MKSFVKNFLSVPLLLCGLFEFVRCDNYPICTFVVAKLHKDLGGLKEASFVSVYAGGKVKIDYLFSDACSLITTMDKGKFDIFLFCGKDVLPDSELARTANEVAKKYYDIYGTSNVLCTYHLRGNALGHPPKDIFRCYKNTFRALDIPLYMGERLEILRRAGSVQQFLEQNEGKLECVTTDGHDDNPSE